MTMWKRGRGGHMCISIHSLCSTVCWSTFGTSYSSNLFGYDATSFDHHLAIICHSSPHLFTSQALSGWMGADAHFQVSPEMFDWVQSQAVAGSLKDIHRVVYKPLLLYASGHCPVERFWMLWTGFSLRLSLYFGALSFSSSLTSPSVPAAENTPTAWGCYQHTLLLGCYSAGDEQSWFPSDMMLRIERILFLRVWGSFRCFFANSRCVSCVFTEDRIEFVHTTIKPRSVECCSDVCPSVGFSHLHIWSRSSTRVSIRFLVTSLDKALLHQLLSLARSQALRVLLVSNFFH